MLYDLFKNGRKISLNKLTADQLMQFACVDSFMEAVNYFENLGTDVEVAA